MDDQLTWIGAAIIAIVAWFVAQAQIKARHVTEERARWRRQIRETASKTHVAFLAGNVPETIRLQKEFRALLNPFDPEDREILNCLENNRPNEFDTRISLLLKHDWERGKLEASFFSLRRAKRISYELHESADDRKLGFFEEYQIRWLRVGCLAIALCVAAAVFICSD